MDDCVIIVDNSNIWIEGKKLSAKIKGLPSTLSGQEPSDQSWRIDFGKLLEFVAEDKKIRKAILVGSRPPESDSLWNAAKSKGFEVNVESRNSQNKEKAVDTKLTMEAAKYIYKTQPAILKLLSGDSDFNPLIDAANEEGWKTEIWAFSNALSSSSLTSNVTRIENLDEHIAKIQL